MESQSKQRADTGNGLSKDEKNSVKKLFTSMLLTVKNLSLYPPGHAICTNSINQFHTQLSAFLNRCGKFKLEIERERIICKGEVVSEGTPEEGTLHYTFFRDGIRWFELMNGIESQELTDIFLLINKYTKLSAEPEGDIVTAFWETPFTHMQYEVAELLWGGDEASEKFSDLVSGKASLDQTEKNDMRESGYQGDPEIDMLQVMLTPEEELKLQEMINMEEDADLTSYLDALLDSLLQNREEVNFSKILDALSEEFTFSLGRKDFVITLKILRGLQYVVGICGDKLPWAEKQIGDFFLSVSSAGPLSPLKDTWDQLTPDDADVLQDIFLILDPKAIQVPLSMFSQPRTTSQRKMLLDLIVMLASQNTVSLDLALGNASGKLLERLVAVILSMESDKSMKYLIKLSRHSSGRIRYEAVKGILKLDPSRIGDMLDMIDDNENSVRQLVLEQMGQARDNTVEEFLISYIKKNKSGSIDTDHILQCLRVLGRCGSMKSVPFLSEILLKWGFLPGARRTALRKGAALALGSLGLNQADKVLERAGKSLFFGVKNSVAKARQELNEEAGSNVR